MNAMTAFQRGQFDEASLCCPRCGTDAGIHFGAPLLIPGGAGLRDEKDARLVIPVYGDACGHEAHLVFLFHGGQVSILAQEGKFFSPFFAR